ncbi:hypothetical protein MMC18_000590 [Xylographa bjoerkii]|nr:hypothetical protein [Xylographa bjoerkii]
MTDQTAWYDAYPKPRNQSPAILKRNELLARFQKGEKPGIDFLLVDLRRTDHEGGTIRGSINLPAQSLYNSLPTLLSLCEGAKVGTVIWYCGSSRGRGSRAAGWFDDLLHDRNSTSIRSVILLDGVAGWARAGEEYTDLMEEYDAASWKKEQDRPVVPHGTACAHQRLDEGK